ncbi:hypothetical protein QMK19_38650 [Streptomyces sp. H10-C2]|uniref:hypothetical protein n=1 Tax=unclassified Streptomyces TaxID=2593676 RepID=UPI0024B8D5A8|nr:MULTISPECIES: hypothetical protein [unclassified Streptomyces]MDJ0346815.1 hypothetical protein [Streptomyces sp. PH10-H1]MDJ0375360.1 hypothetical protein [Streptomyces sp. H10-C2]
MDWLDETPPDLGYDGTDADAARRPLLPRNLLDDLRNAVGEWLDTQALEARPLSVRFLIEEIDGNERPLIWSPVDVQLLYPGGVEPSAYDFTEHPVGEALTNLTVWRPIAFGDSLAVVPPAPQRTR